MKQNASQNRDAEIFRKYIATRKVLIVDPNSAARSSLLFLMRDLGAHPNHLFLVHSYEQAEQLILKLRPSVVLSEFDLGGKCGLELLRKQRTAFPDQTKDSLFVIVTANHTQAAASRSLEEEIDAYIVKPYTLDSVRRTLMKTAARKLSPTPYARLINDGKDLLASGKLDDAEKFFQDAIQNDPAPSLAHSYLGDIRVLKNLLPQAETDFSGGLTHNKIHHRCLSGLYSVLLKQKKHPEAYQVLRRLAKNYPSSSERLAELLRLAILTKNYEDIEQCYQTFKDIDAGSDKKVGIYLSAALVVCGRYYISTKLGYSRAIELFKKACGISENPAKIAREVILVLLEFKHHRDATEFLQFYPQANGAPTAEANLEIQKQIDDEFQVMRFLVFAGYVPLTNALDLGRSLIAKGIRHEKLYETMILKELEAKNPTAAQQISLQASLAFPGRKDYFQSLLNKRAAG